MLTCLNIFQTGYIDNWKVNSGFLKNKHNIPTPAVTAEVVLKFTHFVKPSYFFLMTQGTSWKIPFCLITVVFGGNREALEFAEKSLQLSNLNKNSKPVLFLALYINPFDY